jgi:prevent-host-death family protein
MRYATQIKPISDPKANAASVLEEMAETREPMIVTQNGEARAVLMDVKTHEETEEQFAMLQLVAFAQREIAEGKVVPAAEVIAGLDARIGSAR